MRIAVTTGVPDGICHHRKERHCECRERGLLVLESSQQAERQIYSGIVRLLKLVTGVEISTRPVKRSGSEGKIKRRMSLTAAAEPKRMAFRLSIAISTDQYYGTLPDSSIAVAL